jgi:ankyrin repeat protein
MLQFLLDNGAPPDRHWEQAVAVAARLGHVEVVRLLLSIRPPPSAQELEQQWLEQEQLAAASQWDFRRVPVFGATSACQLGVLEVLLQDGRWSSTFLLSLALKNAASHSFLPAIKLLVQYGADVNHDFGMDPLTTALLGDRLAAAELLLQLGAKPDDSALDRAVSSDDAPAACRLLLQYGAKDTAQNAALYSAAMEHKQEVVHVLLAANQHSLSHTEKTSRLEAALTGAARGGHFQLVQELLAPLEQYLAGCGASAYSRGGAFTNAAQEVEGPEHSEWELWVISLPTRLLNDKELIFTMEKTDAAICPSATVDFNKVVEVLNAAKQRAEAKQEQMRRCSC